MTIFGQIEEHKKRLKNFNYICYFFSFCGLPFAFLRINVLSGWINLGRWLIRGSFYIVLFLFASLAHSRYFLRACLIFCLTVHLSKYKTIGWSESQQLLLAIFNRSCRSAPIRRCHCGFYLYSFWCAVTNFNMHIQYHLIWFAVYNPPSVAFMFAFAFIDAINLELFYLLIIKSEVK